MTKPRDLIGLKIPTRRHIKRRKSFFFSSQMQTPRSSNYLYVPATPPSPTPVGAGYSGPFESVGDKRCKSWPFTLNNYTLQNELDIQLLAKMDNSILYLVYGREVCPTTGTPHLQGFIQFKTKRSFMVVKCLLPWGCHIEPLKKTPFEAADYCKKDDPEPFEFVNLI